MRVVALAGNPNVGKSTVFNALTGMNQHTGNWSGKTVELAQGNYQYKGTEYCLIDLPGTYSLVSRSQEEAVAEQFIREGGADCTVVICDATCLARTLQLALQVMELTEHVVVCVNLIDEAKRAGIHIAAERLTKDTGVPVVLTSADREEGLQCLQETVRNVCDGVAPLQPQRLGCGICGETESESDEIAREFVLRAERIARNAITETERHGRPLTQRLDRVFLHPVAGYAVMLALLFGLFWITIKGANYPSAGLQWCFDRIGAWLLRGANAIGMPELVKGALLDGVYATTARVVAVMLPPMAIFFPIFTILEDFGYLPRVAFLLDHGFHRAGACGKQSLTMCMGFGCNAAGVVGCRIIDSPRERLIAVLTNAFVPCNGRFPALIFLITMSFAGNSALAGAGILTLCVLLAVAMTLAASAFLHKTALRGAASSFALELPPYRRPHIWQVLVRSIKDRTLFVLGRAAAVAAPAGLVIWLLANLRVGDASLLQYGAAFLEKPATLLGMNGAILLAFILGSPANELVLPILIMILTAGGTYGAESSSAMTEVLSRCGWSWQCSLCTIVFFLFHWPCTTTLMTIHKETGSKKWTMMAALLPTCFGIVLCMLLSLLLRFFS